MNDKISFKGFANSFEKIYTKFSTSSTMNCFFEKEECQAAFKELLKKGIAENGTKINKLPLLQKSLELDKTILFIFDKLKYDNHKSLIVASNDNSIMYYNNDFQGTYIEFRNPDVRHQRYIRFAFNKSGELYAETYDHIEEQNKEMKLNEALSKIDIDDAWYYYF